MMIRRRVLAIILALLTTIAFMPSCAWADGFNPEKKITIVKVNPVYADVMTKSALLGSIEENDGPVVEAEQVYSTIEDAGNYVREQMKKRAASVTFKADIPGDEVDNIYAIIGDALKHTGGPDEGDYILWQYAGYEAYLDIGSENYEITFEFGYYTDQQQEDQVTAAVEDVLADMGDFNTYEKIGYIYDYITSTVSYDHVHAATYELSHTAYAAAIEHTAVCQGYAALLYRMLLEEGIDCRIIAGRGNSENHGWNIVKIGSSYYCLDATWDAGKSQYSYFLKADNSLDFPNHERLDFSEYGAYDYTSAEFNDQYPMAAENYSYCTDEHAWDEGTVTKEATCTESGIMTYTCTACHNQKTEAIEPKGHDIVTDEAVEPACEEAGRTEGSHCSVCNEVLKAQEEVSALGHDWVESEVIEPTYFKTGLRKYACTRCDATKEEIIPVLEHTHSAVVAYGYPATCTEAGLTGGTKCSICGNMIEEQEVIPAKGHTVVTDKAVAATCTKTGLTEGSHCSVCGKVFIPQNVVAKKAHSYKGTVAKRATLTMNGKMRYACTNDDCDEAYDQLIYRPDTFKFSTSAYTYDGSVKKPAVTVKDTAGKTLKKGTDYTVTYASGRKSVGKYGVTITMKGKYSGKKTLYFKINPKGTSISSLTKGKKYFTVKWKKQSAKMAKYRITGYQVQYSTSSKMTSPKTATIKGYSKTSKKISKLKSKKKYYVKVRTYRTVNGTTLYGSWSKVKTVTTR